MAKSAKDLATSTDFPRRIVRPVRGIRRIGGRASSGRASLGLFVSSPVEKSISGAKISSSSYADMSGFFISSFLAAGHKSFTGKRDVE